MQMDSIIDKRKFMFVFFLYYGFSALRPNLAAPRQRQRLLRRPWPLFFNAPTSAVVMPSQRFYS